MAQSRRPKKEIKLPDDLVHRLNVAENHSSLWEQRNLFSLPQVHNGVKIRWTMPSLALPYFYIVENNYSCLTVHVLLFRQHKILTIEKIDSEWKVVAVSPEGSARDFLPQNSRKTGQLGKAASKATIRRLSMASGILSESLPRLTESNAKTLTMASLIGSEQKTIHAVVKDYLNNQINIQQLAS